MSPATAPALDRGQILDRFTRLRARTRALFDVLDESVYYERPIALRNPIVFYEGHLPAFAVNTLIKRGLGGDGIDDHLERIFERGIDPASEADAIARGNPAWPSRAEVRAYADAADRLIAEAITGAELERDDTPLLRRAEALWTILEHEEMHQETLAYMWHEVPLAAKHKPALYTTCPPGRPAPPPSRVAIPRGEVTLGTRDEDAPFAWDNERPAHRVAVDAFSIDVHNVTNAEFLEFVDAGGYRDERWWRPDDWAWIRCDGIEHPRFWTHSEGLPVGQPRRSAESAKAGGWLWRAMFEHVPLPDSWPVYVTWAEASAFARWRGQRLMTEAEYHRAAFGTIPTPHERQFPWGDEMPRRVPGNFDFQRWDPLPVGAFPAGASAFGVYDLVGNGWEWTSTVFGPFDGFSPMAAYPEYSSDFFDEEHLVLTGASPFTARGLVRRGFRNWFRPRYPYVYASFRCVKGI
jgi:ergothioneine biosynthesis protein EgtB